MAPRASLESSQKEQFDDISVVFEKNWNKWSADLTQSFINKYSSYLSKNIKPGKKINIPLNKLLKSKANSKMANGQNGTSSSEERISYWQGYIIGYVKDSTEAIISESTNWDEKGYDWFSTYERGQKIGDKVIYYDREKGWLSAVVIKDSTHVTTPDGNYFVAISRIKKIKRKKINKTLWRLLKLKD